MKPTILLIAATLFAVACGRSATPGADSAATTQPVPAAEAAAHPGDVVEWQGGELTPDPALPLVIDFNASWCPPCRMFAPVFEAAAKARAGKAIFVSVNVDNNRDAAAKFNVTAIPQVSVLKPDGKVVTTTGFMDAGQFDRFLDSSL